MKFRENKKRTIRLLHVEYGQVCKILHHNYDKYSDTGEPMYYIKLSNSRDPNDFTCTMLCLNDNMIYNVPNIYDAQIVKATLSIRDRWRIKLFSSVLHTDSTETGYVCMYNICS